MHTDSKIFYMPTLDRTPVGGTKQHYRHVEILSKNGFACYIVVPDLSYKPDWFETQCPIISGDQYFQMLNTDKDFVVVAEIVGRKSIFPGRLIIFNQNGHYSFRNYGFSGSLDSVYTSRVIEGVIVVSEHDRHYLQSIFPRLPIYRIRNGIDHDKFKPASAKKKKISVFLRKNPDDVEQVFNGLMQNELTRQWQFELMENVTEQKVVKELAESVFYLHFGSQEGLPLTTQEAMLSGCYVIGYHGYGGKEIMRPEFSSMIEVGDIMSFIAEVGKAVAEFESSPQSILSKGEKARDFVAANYSLENEERELVEIWRRILSS